MTEIGVDEAPTFCTVHPDRETGLRCNRCDRYMCGACAVSTPVGYRCRECVRQVEDKFFAGRSTDYIVAGSLSAGATMAVVIALSAVRVLQIFLVGFFAGVVFGGILSQLVLWSLERRRGRHTGTVAVAGIVIGTFIGALITRSLLGIGVWLFAGTTAAILYARFR